MDYLEEISFNNKNTPIILSNDNFGTLKGLEHSVNPQLMRYAGETDSLNAHARQEYRRKLFAVYSYLHQVNNLFVIIILYSNLLYYHMYIIAR